MKKISNLEMEYLMGGVGGTSCYFLGLALMASPITTAILYHHEISVCWNS